MKKETIIYPIAIFIISIILGSVWVILAAIPFPEGFERTNEEYVKFIKENHYITLTNPKNYLESKDLLADWLEKEIILRFVTSISLGFVLAIIVGIIINKKDNKSLLATG